MQAAIPADENGTSHLLNSLGWGKRLSDKSSYSSRPKCLAARWYFSLTQGWGKEAKWRKRQFQWTKSTCGKMVLLASSVSKFYCVTKQDQFPCRENRCEHWLLPAVSVCLVLWCLRDPVWGGGGCGVEGTSSVNGTCCLKQDLPLHSFSAYPLSSHRPFIQ